MSQTREASSNPFPVGLHTIEETAEILRISRRSVEKLDKRFEVSKAELVPGKPPPSCPRYGLRRTNVTARKNNRPGREIFEDLEGESPLLPQPGGQFVFN